MTTPDAEMLTEHFSRRVFGRRVARWSLAGTVALVAAACGAPAATKEEVTALDDELKSLQLEVRKLRGGSADAGEAHGSPSADDGHGATSTKAATTKTTATKTTSTKSAADSHAPAASSGAAPHADAPHWAYEGAGGPSNWPSLAPENAVCGSGSTQSPIDISFTQQVAGGRTVFKWDPNSALSVVNNGHTIQANLEKGSKIEIDGTPYDLVQFHFHAPSEHTIEGKQMAMETHFVHKNEKGELAVVGVMHALGLENGALAPIWTALPKAEGDKRSVPSFDLLSVLPRDRQMFRYAGSLTTPPCSEGVRWHVMQSPTTVSQSQVSAFLELFKGGNSRPVQPTKARDILREAA